MNAETVLGVMDVKKIMEFWDIADINNKTEVLYPCTHEFLEQEEIRNNLMEFVTSWSKTPKVYTLSKKTHAIQDKTTNALKRNKEDDNQ